MIICREQSKTLLTNKGRFCSNRKIDTLISKRLSVENKVKLSQLIWADFVTIAHLHTNFKVIIRREQIKTLNWKFQINNTAEVF